jgi:hypothetical protein
VGLLALGAGLPARDELRLPWVFSDEPDLSADFGFVPEKDGKVRVDVNLGGRFAGFGLSLSATRAPQLTITGEFSPLGSLDSAPLVVRTNVDLAETLAEYGRHFDRSYFGSSSPYLYKADLSVVLSPGDYNVSISLKDEGLSFESHRSLHLIVPELDAKQWALGDLKFITAVGKSLDAKGHEHRLLDPNPWRQVGGNLGWDLLLAYNDLGPRPAGKLTRRYSVQRLRGDAAPIWQDAGDAPAKKAQQVWLIRVPEATVKTWQAGVYLLRVELWAGASKIESSKTFEVLP